MTAEMERILSDNPAILSFLVQSFPMFSPNSSGLDSARAPLTIDAINEVVPCLNTLVGTFTGRGYREYTLADFCTPADDANARELAELFNKYGSDKSKTHNYHLVYAPILRQRNTIETILEIGLGTNNVDVVSHMGPEGHPGASHRAFRDFLPKATILGADIDQRVLFNEERIRTFYVDQTRPDSLSDLARQIPGALDLIIDDGLHSPHANLNTLSFGLRLVRPGGWVVIEDILAAKLPIWHLVSMLLPKHFRPHIIMTKADYIFAVKRMTAPPKPSRSRARSVRGERT